MKVIDASALVAVLLAEPEAEAVKAAIAGDQLAAPKLLPFEGPNSCVTKAKKFPDQESKLLDALLSAPDIPIDYFDVDKVGVFVLARRYNLTAYDASYLWLARELDLDLVTLDQDLLAALSAP